MNKQQKTIHTFVICLQLIKKNYLDLFLMQIRNMLILSYIDKMKQLFDVQ